ncbi:MAG: DNA polymerase III subunit gamma/tau [Hyphomicrobiales bacterium]|nr:DNA polymerase III subunit gamma/tau [Hyphomicrobiales bacterium]
MAEESPGEMPDQPGFLDAGLLSTPAPAGQAAPYKVLARKYRPKDFTDLIGQEAMVRTLSNAFSSGRIPQAWMLTGVRGVGKTTTARILARGLNFQIADGTGQPTIELATPGIHCQAIIEGRHIDVMEIDAASNNSVENIRQINDAVRYSPVSARYKVYIIDEVHMLSGSAFNAFLKTLEEPPPHAKFIFATTEIRKVPVTILSRCQRFDLRRIEAGVLVSHLARICAAEQVEADEEALQAIARAAEGSARDAMSLLDQAIAHAAGRIGLDDVRAMLGLADRARVIDLFELLLKGDLAAALAELKAQYDAGADPGTVLGELAEFTHLVTRLKIVPEAGKDSALTQAERVRGSAFAEALSVRVLSRTWQILLKGIAEVKEAGRPLPAAEMVLVRIAHAADLPTPDEALKLLQSGGGLTSGSRGAVAQPAPFLRDPGSQAGPSSSAGFTAARPASAMPASAPRPLSSGSPGGAQASAQTARQQAHPVVRVGSLEDILALAARNRDIKLQAAIQRDLRLVRIEQGRLDISLEPAGDRGIMQELARKLKDWTGQVWMVTLVQAEGQATLREQKQAQDRERKDSAATHPAVQALMAAFPGAKIVDVRSRMAAESPDTAQGGDATDAGLAASLESGEGLFDSDGDPYPDIEF